MPTDGSIAEIYKRHSPQKMVENSMPTWGGNHMELAPTLFYRLAEFQLLLRSGVCRTVFVLPYPKAPDQWRRVSGDPHGFKNAVWAIAESAAAVHQESLDG